MSALINYTTIAFVTEFEMKEMIKHIDATSKVWAPEMKKRGLKRFVCGFFVDSPEKLEKVSNRC